MQKKTWTILKESRDNCKFLFLTRKLHQKKKEEKGISYLLKNKKIKQRVLLGLHEWTQSDVQYKQHVPENSIKINKKNYLIFF